MNLINAVDYMNLTMSCQQMESQTAIYTLSNSRDAF